MDCSLISNIDLIIENVLVPAQKNLVTIHC
jgi:hypothetical protein